MLLEFSVENFRSIKERLTLSMLAAEEETSLKQNLIHMDSSPETALLKSAVIYGANASGKSNVVRGLEFMIYLVRNSHKLQKGDKLTHVVPFRLEKSFSEQPSKFEILFIHEEVKYAYGFIADPNRIHEEYLYTYEDDVQTLVFERTNTHEYEFGEDKLEQDALSKRTLENALYLSIATQWNYHTLAKVFDWFLNKVEVWVEIYEEPNYGITAEYINEDDEAKNLVLNVLANSDLGIKGIEVNKEELSIRTPDDISDARRLELLSFFSRQLTRYDVSFLRFFTDENGEQQQSLFKLFEESTGTQRLFNLIGPWIDVLRSGKLLIIDELENSLHPLMVVELFRLFHDAGHNKNAQLIITTHNTNLLDDELLRRDQIWFTEKDPDQGNTHLYSLCEFVPRQDEDYEAGYLKGRYGAVPFFGKEFLF